MCSIDAASEAAAVQARRSLIGGLSLACRQHEQTAPRAVRVVV